MEQIMGFLTLPLVLAAVQWGAGYLLKRNPNVPNQVIPLATYLLALIGYTVTPAEANAATLLGGLTAPANIFLAALIQNLMVTGTHSTFKNSVLPALTSLLGGLFQKKS